MRCTRVDDLWGNSTIIQDIFDLIFVAAIIVVDFSGRTSNVMYETGIAHSFGKHVVPITQSLGHVPFDCRPPHFLSGVYTNSERLSILADALASRLLTIIQGHSWSD